MDAATAAHAALTDYGGIALVITSLGSLIASVGTTVLSVLNRHKLQQNEGAMRSQTTTLETIKTQTNGMADDLKKAAHAEGHAQGTATERARNG